MVLPCHVWNAGLAFLLASILPALSLDADQPPVDFNREIRPVLSDKCYACHGPNEADREGGFRLD